MARLLICVIALAAAACGPGTRDPRGGVRLRIGYTSAVDIGDLPSLIAQRALEERGYRVETTFFAQPELAVDALARGDVDIANGGARAFWAADAKGADLVMLMEHSENGYLIAGGSGISRCEDLHGRTLALSSSGSLPTAIGRAFLRQCAEAEPRVLTLPHSGDRLAALLVGSVDAAILQRADVGRLEREAPGRFRALAAPRALAHLDLEGVFVSRRFLAEHRPVVADYIRERVFANRRVLDDASLLLQEARRWPDLGPLDAHVVAGEVAAPAWTRDGGVTEASIAETVDFFVTAGSLPPSLDARIIADLSILSDALDAVASNESPTPPALGRQ